MATYQLLTNALPGIPTLTGGMKLGSTGVSRSPLRTLGSVAGLSGADGSFSAALGTGDIDYDSAGYLYVADPSNSRVQRFSKAADGSYTFDSKCSASSALGSAVTLDLVAIDRTRNQIHLAASNDTKTGNWIGVWDLSLWGAGSNNALTVANRLRAYGTNNTGNGSGKANTGQTLTLVGDFAFVTSMSGDLRALQWNHTTGALISEATQSFVLSKIISDGAGKYWAGASAGTFVGFRQIDPSTWTSLARLDNPNPAGLRYTRRNRFVLGADVTSCIYYGGRVYVRELTQGRILGWKASDNSFVDIFAMPGGMGTSGSDHWGDAPGQYFSLQIPWGKMGLWVAPSGSGKTDDLLMWSAHADNDNQQSFLAAWPLSTATATWTKNDWSTGVNTLKALGLAGVNLSSEKTKVRLRKNAGAWVTLTLDQLNSNSAIGAVGTFTTGDTLTVELSLSVWDRLDGHATLIAVRDKLTPSEVTGVLLYDDSAGDVYVPYLASGLRGRQGGQAAVKARQGA